MNYSKVSLRLFLSADISGSTAFKHLSSAPKNWQQFFLQFYKYLPTRIEARLGSSNFKLVPWKSVGDEIVFISELTSLQQIRTLVECFRKSAADYRTATSEVKDGKVDIKLTGWTAGFPVGNMLIEAPHVPPGQPSMQEDYIGPSMDIGFRLVKYSNPRKMYLSVELAWLLSHPALRAADDRSVEMYFDGLIPLKGVGKKGLYPGIWLDNFKEAGNWNIKSQRHSESNPAEHASYPFNRDKLLMDEESLTQIKVAPAKIGNLHEYCKLWLEEQKFPFMVPFIKNDSTVGQMPKNYEERLRDIEMEIAANFKSSLSVNPPTSNTPIKPKKYQDLFNKFTSKKTRNR